MKKIVLIIAVALMSITLSGCGAKYTVQDVDRAAEQLTMQQNIDSAVKSGVKKGDYDDMVDEAARSLNAFKNSSAASNLPEEIINGLSDHLAAHQDAKVAWQDDQDNAQKDYDAAYDEYLDDMSSISAPNIDDYFDKYDTVQDSWAKVPDLQPVADKIAECRKTSK